MTPDELRSDPELAILDALDYTLGLAIYALVAIYPELTDAEIPPWRRVDTKAGHAASHLIDCSEEVHRAVGRYRAAVLQARKADENQDLPF